MFPVIRTDNGSEFSNPKEIEYDENGLSVSRVFYCGAGSPYQKGAIEVNHELIRRILPKGSLFDALTQEDVNRMMDHINSYKRKKLNNRSPYEAFRYYNINQGKGQKRYGFLFTKRAIHLQTGKEGSMSIMFNDKVKMINRLKMKPKI